MPNNPSYEKLEKRIRVLEEEILEHKSADKALHESEEKYSRLFHHSNDGIFLHDLDGNILDANQKVLALFGYTNAELSTIKIPELHPEAALKKSRQAFERIVQDGYIQFEIDFKKKNGDIFTAEVSSSLFEVGGRKVIQGIVRDVTERKFAEDALQESEERYRSLFRNNHSVMLLIDPDNADIVDANPAATAYYGWSYKEITSKKITDINTLTKVRVYNEIERASKEDCRHFLFRHRLANGDIRDVEVYSGPLIIHGRKLLYSIIHDITERKRAQEERDRLIHDLQEAMSEIKTLKGILPFCSFCKKIRDDKGYWEKVDVYIRKHSQADISHGVCPECMQKHYPEVNVSND